MAGICRSKKEKRKETDLRLLAGTVVFGFFLSFFFGTVVPGHEHIDFTFSVLNDSSRP